MNYLVTGGAGFIGSNLVDHLLSRDPYCNVTVLDKLTYAGYRGNLELAMKSERVNFVWGDVCDPTTVRHLCERANIVIHAAAESHVDRSISSPSAFGATNFMGTLVMLEAVKAAEVDLFVYISTDEVYGSRTTGSFVETDSINPRNPYSATKAGADRLVSAYHETYGLNTIIIRPSNNYGPRQFPEKLIPFFVWKAMRGEDLPVYGNGEQVRDWLHVYDHCRAIGKIITKGTVGGVYNIPGMNERKNIEVIRIILDELRKPESLIKFVEDRVGHDSRYAIDGSALEALGWYPRIKWEDGIRETIRWYTVNKNWLDDAFSRANKEA